MGHMSDFFLERSLSEYKDSWVSEPEIKWYTCPPL